MKYFFCIIILCSSYNLSAADTKKSSNSYITAESVFESHKANPKKVIKGTFLLPIKSITTQGLDSLLNTHSNPQDPKNITVIMPVFIKNHFQRSTQTSLESLFINHQILVKGQINWTALEPLSEQDKAESKNIKTLKPSIKLNFTDQLVHYD